MAAPPVFFPILPEKPSFFVGYAVPRAKEAVSPPDMRLLIHFCFISKKYLHFYAFGCIIIHSFDREVERT